MGKIRAKFGEISFSTVSGPQPREHTCSAGAGGGGGLVRVHDSHVRHACRMCPCPWVRTETEKVAICLCTWLPICAGDKTKPSLPRDPQLHSPHILFSPPHSANSPLTTLAIASDRAHTRLGFACAQCAATTTTLRHRSIRRAMERDLQVMPPWGREVAAPCGGGATESSPSSRSTSGCQSGWTVYLDHSNGMRYHPCDDPAAAAAQRWVSALQAADDDGGDVEDSMASDASSGSRPRPRDQDGEQTRRDFDLEQQGPRGYIRQHSHSSSVHCCSASSGSAGGGVGGFGSSTWSSSRGSQGRAKGHVARRRRVVVHGGGAETTTHPYRGEIVVVHEEDELDDTASSSAVFSSHHPMAMVHVN
jgi:hypothetical protein